MHVCACMYVDTYVCAWAGACTYVDMVRCQRLMFDGFNYFFILSFERKSLSKRELSQFC